MTISTWTCHSRWQSWQGRRGRWGRWWSARCSSPPRSPGRCRNWKLTKLVWKQNQTETFMTVIYYAIMMCSDDHEDDLGDTMMVICRYVQMFKIIWLYDQNLFERACRAVMTMRGISVICWQSFDHMIVWSWSYECMIMIIWFCDHDHMIAWSWTNFCLSKGKFSFALAKVIVSCRYL